MTEELREALLELEEEKEKRIHIEEEIQLKSHEQDELKNKLCALLEDKEQAVVRKEASPLQEIEEATDSGKQSPERGDEHLPTLQVYKCVWIHHSTHLMLNIMYKWRYS